MKSKIVVYYLFTASLYGGDFSLNTLNIEDPKISKPAEKADNLVEAYSFTLMRRMEEMSMNEMNPLANTAWTMMFADNPRAVGDHFDDIAEKLFTKPFLYSAREASTYIPIVPWFESRLEIAGDSLKGLFNNQFRNVVRDSVAAVEEEEFIFADTSYSPSAMSWWNTLRQSGLRYGVRPFRTSPYAYIGLPLKWRDSPFALAHTRYHYQRFRTHRFEVALSLKPVEGYHLDIGYSYKLGEESPDVLTFNLYKYFIRKNVGLFAGVSVEPKFGMIVGVYRCF